MLPQYTRTQPPPTLLSDLVPLKGTLDPLQKSSSAIRLRYNTSNASNSTPRLPGCPQVPLSSSSVSSYAAHELTTPELDAYQLKGFLWLVATPSSAHISSLTHQITRGRDIVVTERAGLHCVWVEDRVFLKPLPRWLLSASFWAYFLEGQVPVDAKASEQQQQQQPTQADDEEWMRIARAAKGFLRSYAYLITHESDFEIAREKRLVPKDLSWEDFCISTSKIAASVTDAEVSPRYRYGDLRLSRLNLWAPVVLGSWDYQRVYGQYGAYFAHILAPVFFAIGILSVVLTAMQTVLAGMAVDQSLQDGTWEEFLRVAIWFATVTIVAFAVVAGGTVLLLGGLLLNELRYALFNVWRRRAKSSRVVP